MKRSKSKASKVDAKIDELNEGMPVPPEGTTAIPHIPVAAKGMVQGAAPGSVAPTDAPLDSDDPESMLAYQSLMRHRKQRRRKRIILIAVVSALVLGAAGCFAVRSMLESQIQSAPVMQTVPIMREDFSDAVSAQGTLQPISQVVVTPEIEGIIETLNVAEGSTVAAGDVLLTIKNDDLDKAVNEAALSVRSAENGIQTAKNALNAAYVEESQGNGGGVPDAKIALDQAYLALDQANEAYEAAVANAEKRTVRAAEGGSVVVMNAVVGQSVGSAASAANGGKLIQIANLSQMTVSVQVNELDIAKIQVGQKARASFSALPELELEAEVTRIATVAGGESEFGGGYGVVTYTVDLLIPNPDPRLKPGMTASVDIMMQHVPDALTVPVSAIQEDGAGNPCVYVVTDPETQASEPRAIQILAQNSTTAAIEGDVAEGDEVELMGGMVGMDPGDDMYAGEAYESVGF